MVAPSQERELKCGEDAGLRQVADVAPSQERELKYLDHLSEEAVYQSLLHRSVS